MQLYSSIPPYIVLSYILYAAEVLCENRNTHVRRSSSAKLHAHAAHAAYAAQATYAPAWLVRPVCFAMIKLSSRISSNISCSDGPLPSLSVLIFSCGSSGSTVSVALLLILSICFRSIFDASCLVTLSSKSTAAQRKCHQIGCSQLLIISVCCATICFSCLALRTFQCHHTRNHISSSSSQM